MNNKTIAEFLEHHKRFCQFRPASREEAGLFYSEPNQALDEALGTVGHAGPDFGRELDVLTADMRSSSYEAALIRFEARMGSAIISDIVRGLIGILRGDDGRMYFQMLSHDLKALELQRLKAKAAKIPPKIRVFSFVMLMCFMMTYIVIIVYQIVNSLGSLF